MVGFEHSIERFSAQNYQIFILNKKDNKKKTLTPKNTLIPASAAVKE